MAILPIKIYGDEVLRRKASPVTDINGDLAEFIDSLVLTMKQAKGLGLAANQVGLTSRIFAVDMSFFDALKKPLVIINPVVVASSGEATAEEGCLSFPGLYKPITRAKKAAVVGLDRNGKEIIVEGSDLVARVLLHEIDHLDGTLFIDRLKSSELESIRDELQKIKDGERVG